MRDRPKALMPLARVGLPLTLAATLAGCSASYESERLFWNAHRLRAQILEDPGGASPEQFEQAIEAFRLVTRKRRGSELAARAHLAIGSLYALQRQYGRAREAFETLVKEHGADRSLRLRGLAAIVRTHEAEQAWEEVVAAYRRIAEEAPWSVLGLEVPLRIAAVHEHAGEPEQGAREYRRAVETYRDQRANAPSPEVAGYVTGYLALAYQPLCEWRLAVETLEELADGPAAANRPLALLTLGAIYESKLSKQEQAEAMYQKLVREFPEHPLGTVARLHLEHLGVATELGADAPQPGEAAAGLSSGSGPASPPAEVMGLPRP